MYHRGKLGEKSAKLNLPEILSSLGLRGYFFDTWENRIHPHIVMIERYNPGVIKQLGGTQHGD
jgi:hypothetical protein